MYGPHYVWIFLNSKNQWWIPGAKEGSACSNIEMKCQIQNHFTVYHTNLIPSKGRFFSYNNKVSGWHKLNISWVIFTCQSARFRDVHSLKSAEARPLEVVHQTRKTVVEHISKHREEGCK